MSRSNENCRLFVWDHIYRAKVIDNNDPDKKGRVLVWIPDVMADLSKNDGIWAYPAIAGYSKDQLENQSGFCGSFVIPTVHSYVYVFFENGDPSQPRYFPGGAYISDLKVPVEVQMYDSARKWLVFKSCLGNSIIVSDDEKDSRVEITGIKRKLDPSIESGNSDSVYTIKGNQSVIVIDNRDGYEKIMIEDHNGNFVIINTKNNSIDIFSNGKVNCVAKNIVNIFSTQDVNIKCKNLNIDAENLSIKAINGNIKADADLNVESTANCNIKGTMINLQMASQQTQVNTVNDIELSGERGGDL